ncbi:hypothetical protein ABMA28_014229 [Loxostege sticticalis]|uniref:Uncharacterized protein n=1 Tax=Loxostege sticticalis TaxID=481309 RepID=A0ABD0TG20_LOXSC
MQNFSSIRHREFHQTNIRKIKPLHQKNINWHRAGLEPATFGYPGHCSYQLRELHKIWHLGTRKSVALESVKYLAQRGTKPSTKDPNKYHFSRDSRLKCPTLYINAIDSPFSSDEYSIEMREVIEKNNPDYEIHFMSGTHYVHLNNPERLAPLIKQFMNKHNLRI